MELEETLLVLEHNGWEALAHGKGSEFYDDCLTEDAVMLLPGVGLMDREAVLGALDGKPWAWYSLEEPHVIRLGEDSAVVAYRCSAERDGEPEYRALMSTVYVRRGDRWKVAFHQQTPLYGRVVTS